MLRIARTEPALPGWTSATLCGWLTARQLNVDARSSPPDGLPLAEVAKSLLCGNSRAQLTTVRADSPAAGTEPKVTSSLVQAVAPRGYPPLVLLHPSLHANSIKDILTNPANPASLCYGATDPPGVLQRYRAAGWYPPRFIVLGHLIPLKTSEVLTPGALRFRNGVPTMRLNHSHFDYFVRICC